MKYSYMVYKIKRMPFHVVEFSSKDYAGFRIYNTSKDASKFIDDLENEFDAKYSYNGFGYFSPEFYNDEWIYYTNLNTKQIYIKC